MDIRQKAEIDVPQNEELKIWQRHKLGMKKLKLKKSEITQLYANEIKEILDNINKLQASEAHVRTSELPGKGDSEVIELESAGSGASRKETTGRIAINEADLRISKKRPRDGETPAEHEGLPLGDRASKKRRIVAAELLPVMKWGAVVVGVAALSYQLSK